MNVSLPEEMRVRIDALVESGDYQTNSDYIRAVVRTDLERRAAVAQLADQLKVGFEGEAVPYSPEMWRKFSERVLEEIGKPGA